ncbi:hypothetical protein [Klebsiella pasteurii]|uniref:hypothetical protein n=1 Tax=Klebsiella pasteurii TaxID=2587529 RepID=UPI001167C89A|nr:hypothetical protein [Klebsiella pasteurii]QUE97092.1 hypothetical protein KCG39_03005 [Klebsiella pasteurii]VUS24506.1 hypothetical protein SB6414_00017 [Klebsiella pasteurii]
MDFEFISLTLIATVIPLVIAFISNKNLKGLRQKKIDFDNIRNQNKENFEAKKDKLKFH